MPSVSPDIKAVEYEVARSLSLIKSLVELEATQRHFIAELVALRLFSLVESTIESLACKIVCGASYSDGSSPVLLRGTPTGGIERARDAMKKYDRTEERRLRWSKVNEVKKNLDKLCLPSEYFVVTIAGHGDFISELRKVRNHIAHGNRGTRIKFQHVVRKRYGANTPSITPGKLLISSRFSPLVIEEYCRKARIILKSSVKAK